MNFLGIEIFRNPKPKADDSSTDLVKSAPSSLQSVGTWRNILGLVREPFAGAWQQDVVIDQNPRSLLAFSAVYCCVTGIAGDVAKMRIKLDRNINGIWDEIDGIHGNDSLNPTLKLLRDPNHFQNRIQFIQSWVVSKLLYGNAYILKERDRSGNVIALYVLNPIYIKPLVAPDGGVYYALSEDWLSQLEEGKTVPASEIIHDRMPELWHPLVGVSPLYACAMSVTMGNKIQNNSTAFFANASRPGGILTAPGEIAQDTADRLKAAWESNYGGANVGRVAVLGDGLTFNAIRETAEQSMLADQLKWTVSDVARAFHYPEYKLGGPMPSHVSVDALITAYYSDCLQYQIESIELCLDKGLELPLDIGTEFDTDGLMRMDMATLYETIGKGIQGRFLAPNEGRKRANYKPVPGGDSPMAQQQDFSLAALAKRDALPDPFASSKPLPPAGTGADSSSNKAFEIEHRREIETLRVEAREAESRRDADRLRIVALEAQLKALATEPADERLSAIESKHGELVKAAMQTELFSLRIAQLNSKLDRQASESAKEIQQQKKMIETLESRIAGMTRVVETTV